MGQFLVAGGCKISLVQFLFRPLTGHATTSFQALTFSFASDHFKMSKLFNSPILLGMGADFSPTFEQLSSGF